MTLPIEQIDHVGIAVEDLAQAVVLYQVLLGKAPDHYEEVTSEEVKTAFFDLHGVAIELLQATANTSPIAKFIAKQGRAGVHHICFQVDDISAKLEELKQNGFILIDSKPKMGAHGKLVAFVHPKSASGVLIELSQSMR